MQAIVTGSSGFLGRRLVRAMCEDGVSVRCLVRPSSDVGALRDELGGLWGGVDVVRAELHDGRACRAALAGGDVLFHVAAGLTGGASQLFLNTVAPTRVLLNAAADVGIGRTVLVSSLGVYGCAALRPGSLLTEATPVDRAPHRRDPYTYSKVVQEEAAWQVRSERGLPLIVIRPGVIFGPGRGVLSGRVGLQLGGWLIRMGGRQTLPYTYVENCAAAIRQAGFAESIDGEVFNIVDDGLPTAAKLVRMLRKSGVKPKSVWIPGCLIGPLSAGYERYRRYSGGQLPDVISRYKSESLWKPVRYTNQKAKTRLGWTPDVAFPDALARSISS